MPGNLLTVSHLTRRFGPQLAIADLSFAVPAGDRVTIFAPTGAGKSTLINILTGLDRGYQGTFALAASNPATVFQEPRLFPYLTVEENIFLPIRIRKLLFTADLLAQYRRWLEVCELTPYAGHYPYQLSGGMKQKTALIRAFLLGPDFVMLDEPFQSIDLTAKQAIARHILAAYPGITLLFVTHARAEIPLLARSVLLFSTNCLAGFTMHDALQLSLHSMEVIND